MAAGSSSRLGRPKQLLSRGKESMIEYITSECVESKLGPTYIVTGKYHDVISIKIDSAKILYNTAWQEGMSSSIAFAISTIDRKLIDGAIVVLSDQVYFSKKILAKISAVAKSKRQKIINCKYEKGMGPPTYFDKSLFGELEKLSGDDGAKSIIQKHIENSISIDFTKGSIDLDTPADLDILSQF